jgi:hypothetical protein
VEHSVRFELTWSLRSPVLQTSAFNRLATSANGPESRSRTGHMLLTKQLLCLLSYLGENLVRPEGFEPSCIRLEHGCLNPLGHGREDKIMVPV